MHERIQRYLRARAAAGREAVPAGAFTLYLHPVMRRHPFLNYAIPNEGATRDDGAGLVAAARERSLVPRVEAVEPCAPWIRDMPGFEVELEPPLMACTTPVHLRSPARLVPVKPRSRHVEAMLTAQHEAFGDPPPTEERIATWSELGVAALVGGEVVGGATFSAPMDGMTEVGGIAVLEPFRRQGIAGALTAEATRLGLAAGASLVLLSPGDDGAQRVYERAGFVTASRMIFVRASA
jgi:predicted GNAT family acetyltransferase